ncbi:MAG: hypothetical protein HKN33_19295 [Pyrinomonadaceae bacterium]|nr:hypothetical protein [Pyrinomonadaceae bacterium]
MFNLEESKWEITESGGVGINAYEIAFKGGYLYLKHSETSKIIRLMFGGAGLGIGTPSFKQKPEEMKDMLSGGVAPPKVPRAKTVYRFPMGGNKLTLDEIGGPYLMLDCGANYFGGLNMFALYFLGKAAAGLTCTPVSFPLAIHLAYGAIFSAGFTVTGGKGLTATVTGGLVSAETVFN